MVMLHGLPWLCCVVYCGYVAWDAVVMMCYLRKQSSPSFGLEWEFDKTPSVGLEWEFDIICPVKKMFSSFVFHYK